MTAVTEVLTTPDGEAVRTVAATLAQRTTVPTQLAFAVLDGALLAVVAGPLLQVGLPAASAAGIAWAGLSLATRPRALPGYESVRRSVRAVFRAAVVSVVGGWAYAAVTDLPFTDRQFVGLVVTAVLGSLTVRGVELLVRHNHAAAVRVLVVGEVGDRDATAAATAVLTCGRYSAIGAVGPAGVEAAVRHECPDAVLLVPGPGFSGRDVQRLTWQAESYGLPVLVSTRLQDVAPQRSAPIRVGGLSLLYLEEAHGAWVARRVKQVWEWVVALLLLMVLAPCFVVIGVLIRCDSAGPVFFRQIRVGRNGRPFRMWKFRTMVVDAEARRAALGDRPGHVLFKHSRDPRVTRVGRFLRRFSIDELPQLVNVLLGQMALVGPRPALPAELEQFDEDPMRRLAVAPGMTGLWQVSGRSDLSWEETVRLDLDYVDNWSLVRDLGIVLRTVRAVLRASGAY